MGTGGKEMDANPPPPPVGQKQVPSPVWLYLPGKRYFLVESEK